MTLIEGVGDEVTQFFIVLFAVIVCYVAWWTTSTREQLHIRIFVFNGRQRNYSRLSSHVQTTSIMEGNRIEELSSNETTVAETVAATAGTSSNEEVKPETSTANTLESTSSNQNEDDEPSTILRIMDQNVNMVRQRRVDRFEQRTLVENLTSEVAVEDSSSEQKSVENKSESSTASNPPENNSGNEDKIVDSLKIVIKLKFLNDELKAVDGKLDENLGIFKRRHFETELSSNKVVRLIFNGQVLQQDNVTLASCGLFDNCVVHCLIHQKKQSAQETMSENSQDSRTGIGGNTIPRSHLNGDNNHPARDWDLGNLLFFLVSFVLVTVWYFRYEYAHLYTVTATIALVVVTGIFAVVMFGLYFPDREQTVPHTIH